MTVGILDAMREAMQGRTTRPVSSARGAVRARTGQRVFVQADPSDTIYLLVSGELRLTSGVNDDEASESLTLLCRGPAMLGDRDALLGTELRETASCISVCELRSWSTEAFQSEWRKSAELRAWLAADLADRYARCVYTVSLQQAPLERRIAALLVDLESTHAPSADYLSRVFGVAEGSILRSLAKLEQKGALSRTAGARELYRDRLQELTREERLPLVHTLTPEP